MNWSHFFLILCFYPSIFYAALEQNSVIHTPKGLIPIQNLEPSEYIISAGGQLARVIENIGASTDTLYVIELENEVICTTADQLFYDPKLDQGVTSAQLSNHSIFIDITNNHVPCIKVSKLNKVNTAFELSLDKPHTFFVGQRGILAHNSFIAAIPAIPATLSTICKVVTIVAAGLSYLKFSKNIKAQSHYNLDQLASLGPTPNDPNENKEKEANHHFSNLEIKQSINHVIKDPNKMHHIFDKKIHNLDALIKKFGSPEKLFVRLYIN